MSETQEKVQDRAIATNPATIAQDAPMSKADALVAQLSERAPNAVGRPGYLTQATAQKIINAVREGNYYVTACALAGLSYQTFQVWMNKGEAEHHTEETLPYAVFRDAVIEAEAEWEATAIRRVSAAGDKDWKATMSLLGRRHRARWSEQPIGGESKGQHVTINVGIALPGSGSNVQTIEAQVVSVPMLDDE